MDRLVKTKINGIERELNYSVEVMFEMTDEYGDIQKALDLIGTESREGFLALRWFLVRMANDAELCRRNEGYTPREMLNEDDITLRMPPDEYRRLVEDTVEAISRGYAREEEDGVIDLGLAEINKKKTRAEDNDR